MDALVKQLFSGGTAGVVAGFIIVIVTGSRGDWIFRRAAEQLREAAEARCDAESRRADTAEATANYYRDLLFQSLGVAQKAANVAEAIAPPAPRRARNESRGSA